MQVYLEEKRTAFSKTYTNGDGTLTTEISQTPQHFLNEAGEWQEINNELIKVKDGYQNKDNNLDIKFKEKISEDTLGVSISEDNYKVDLQLQSLENTSEEVIQPTEGIVSDNQITYPEIFDEMSATYTVGENFVKEDIIIENKPESGLPESFTYKVKINDLTYKTIDNTVWLFDPKSNEPVFKIEAPFMYDSYVPEEFISSGEVPSIPEEARSYDIQVQTTEEDGYLIIKMVPNQEWLNADERIYPIVIDPTIYRIQGTALTTDTILRSGSPTQVGGNDTEIGVGRSGDNIVRSLLRFDLSAIEKASEVLSVDLNLYLSSTNSTSPIDISTHKITNSWNENEATWQNRTTSTKWTAAGADFNQTAYTTVKGIGTVPTKENIKDGLVKWSLPVSNVYGWVDNPAINLGILLKSTSESTKVYKKFWSSESTVDSAYKPKLVITYKTSARLGLEDYWDYYEYELSEGKGYANIGTQNNVVQYSDFTLANYGDFGFEFKRTYNSKTIEESALGKGTTFTGNEKLYINTGATNSNLEYQDADGTVHEFVINGNTYTNPAGFQGKLTKTDGNTFELSEENIKTTFKIREVKEDTPVQVAYITKQEDLYGHTISYNYNSENQLKDIVTGLGDTLTFNYRNGYLVEAISKNKKVEYEYLANHFIQKVHVYDANENKLLSTTKLNYINNQLTTIIDSVGNITTFTYDSDGVRFGLDSITLQDKESKDETMTTFALDNANLKATVKKTWGRH